jgi:hypothetical protein
VLIIEIDSLDAEALQTRVTGRADVFRAAIDADDRPILAYRAELGGEKDVAARALTSQPAADELLILMRPVDVGGVQEVDAEFERAIQCGERLLVIASGIELAHAHAAEANRGDFWTIGP